VSALTVIGFDADDTLWHNERVFRLTEDRFAALLGEHAPAEDISRRLLAAERRNLELYGYGIKGFTLSMIETALEVTEGRASATAIREILDAGRDMMRHPVEIFPGVRETLEALRDAYRLVVITKGDLFDQERKLAASGLGELFDAVEIVSDKNAATYRRLFSRHGAGAESAMMIGNSVKSDILPAIEAGSWGVHVPYHIAWALEHAEAPVDHPRFKRVTHLREIATLLAEIAAR
jgi:putative hydrolase of the HAD superfamily